MAEKKSKCPDCGNWYVDLNNHNACRGKNGPGEIEKEEKEEKAQSQKHGKSHDKHKVYSGGKVPADLKKEKKKDQCPDCGKWYVDLSKHNTCSGGKVPADQKKEKEKDQCPDCGKWYVDLSKHNTCSSRKDTPDLKKEKEKDQCPDCGKWYVDLSKHNTCSSRKDTPDLKKEKEKDQCPDCGKWYVDLSKHNTCSSRKDAPDLKKEKEKDQCPDCGKWYVDLSKHNTCSGGKNTRGQKKEKDQCPDCGKWYVDLSKHNTCSGGKVTAVQKKEKEKDQCLDCGNWYVELSKHNTCSGGKDTPVLKKEKEGDDGGKWYVDPNCCRSDFISEINTDTPSYPAAVEVHDSNTGPDVPELRDSKGITFYSPSRKLDNEDCTTLDKFVNNLVDEKIISHSGNPRMDIQSFFRDEVQLRKGEIDTAAEYFPELQQTVVEFLESRTLWKWAAFRAGSHYDRTKVSRPNEMDCVLLPELPVKLEPVYSGSAEGFCKIRVRSQLPEVEHLCDGEYFNKKKYREYIFRFMKMFVQEHSEGDTRCESNLSQPASPSYCIKYYGVTTDYGLLHIDVDFVPALHISTWPPPSVARDLKTIPQSNLSPKIKVEDIMSKGFNAVTNTCGSPEDQDLQWKISCSYAEKKLTYHGESSCWKPVMRTMKRMVEIAKGIPGLTITGKSLEIQKAVEHIIAHHLRKSDFQLRFSTYYIRSLMWHLLYEETAGLHVWKKDTQERRLRYSLGKLQQMITGEITVPHFFIPGIRDIMRVRKRDREFMYILVRATENIFSKKRDRRENPVA